MFTTLIVSIYPDKGKILNAQSQEVKLFLNCPTEIYNSNNNINMLMIP